jgi:hypothetical protein
VLTIIGRHWRAGQAEDGPPASAPPSPGSPAGHVLPSPGSQHQHHDQQDFLWPTGHDSWPGAGGDEDDWLGRLLRNDGRAGGAGGEHPAVPAGPDPSGPEQQVTAGGPWPDAEPASTQEPAQQQPGGGALGQEPAPGRRQGRQGGQEPVQPAGDDDDYLSFLLSGAPQDWPPPERAP